MKQFLIICVFSICSYSVLSQNYVDILKISGSTTPDNTFDTSNSKTKINQIEADLTVPIKMNDHFTIISGAIYENFQTKLFEDGVIKNFGSTTLKIGANKVFNDQWSSTTVLLPKIASDYTAISEKDFQFGVVALMKYKKSDDLNYKFGLYYNTELFGPFFVPMFGMYYLSPNKKFETNIMLPLQVDLNYKLVPFMNIGLNFNGQNRTYHLTNVSPNNTSNYLVRSTNELYGYLKFNVTKSLSLQTKIGYSVARYFKVYNDNDKVTLGLPAVFIGDNRHQLNSKFSNGLIFQASLLYRFNL